METFKLQIHHSIIIPNELGGLRLDQAVTKLFPDYSRTQIQEWIKNGSLTVNQAPARSRVLVMGGETVTIGE